MLDNVFQRTICTLASIIISIVQYLRNRHTFPKLTVTQIESNVRNFLRNKLLEIGSFYRTIDALIKTERAQTKKANKIPGSLIDLSPQQIDSEACPQALLPLYAICSAYWVASSSVATGSALSSYDSKSSLAEQKLASEDSQQPSPLLSDKLYPK